MKIKKIVIALAFILAFLRIFFKKTHQGVFLVNAMENDGGSDIEQEETSNENDEDGGSDIELEETNNEVSLQVCLEKQKKLIEKIKKLSENFLELNFTLPNIDNEENLNKYFNLNYYIQLFKDIEKNLKKVDENYLGEDKKKKSELLKGLHDILDGCEEFFNYVVEIALSLCTSKDFLTNVLKEIESVKEICKSLEKKYYENLSFLMLINLLNNLNSDLKLYNTLKEKKLANENNANENNANENNANEYTENGLKAIIIVKALLFVRNKWAAGKDNSLKNKKEIEILKLFFNEKDFNDGLNFKELGINAEELKEITSEVQKTEQLENDLINIISIENLEEYLKLKSEIRRSVPKAILQKKEEKVKQGQENSPVSEDLQKLITEKFESAVEDEEKNQYFYYVEEFIKNTRKCFPNVKEETTKATSISELRLGDLKYFNNLYAKSEKKLEVEENFDFNEEIFREVSKEIKDKKWFFGNIHLDYGYKFGDYCFEIKGINTLFNFTYEFFLKLKYYNFFRKFIYPSISTDEVFEELGIVKGKPSDFYYSGYAGLCHAFSTLIPLLHKEEEKEEKEKKENKVYKNVKEEIKAFIKNQNKQHCEKLKEEFNKNFEKFKKMKNEELEKEVNKISLSLKEEEEKELIEKVKDIIKNKGNNDNVEQNAKNLALECKNAVSYEDKKKNSKKELTFKTLDFLFPDLNNIITCNVQNNFKGMVPLMPKYRDYDGKMPILKNNFLNKDRVQYKGESLFKPYYMEQFIFSLNLIKYFIKNIQTKMFAFLTNLKQQINYLEKNKKYIEWHSSDKKEDLEKDSTAFFISLQDLNFEDFGFDGNGYDYDIKTTLKSLIETDEQYNKKNQNAKYLLRPKPYYFDSIFQMLNSYDFDNINFYRNFNFKCGEDLFKCDTAYNYLLESLMRKPKFLRNLHLVDFFDMIHFKKNAILPKELEKLKKEIKDIAALNSKCSKLIDYFCEIKDFKDFFDKINIILFFKLFIFKKGFRDKLQEVSFNESPYWIKELNDFKRENLLEIKRIVEPTLELIYSFYHNLFGTYKTDIKFEKNKISCVGSVFEQYFEKFDSLKDLLSKDEKERLKVFILFCLIDFNIEHFKKLIEEKNEKEVDAKSVESSVNLKLIILIFANFLNVNLRDTQDEKSVLMLDLKELIEKTAELLEDPSRFKKILENNYETFLLELAKDDFSLGKEFFSNKHELEFVKKLVNGKKNDFVDIFNTFSNLSNRVEKALLNGEIIHTVFEQEDYFNKEEEINYETTFKKQFKDMLKNTFQFFCKGLEKTNKFGAEFNKDFFLEANLDFASKEFFDLQWKIFKYFGDRNIWVTPEQNPPANPFPFKSRKINLEDDSKLNNFKEFAKNIIRLKQDFSSEKWLKICNFFHFMDFNEKVEKFEKIYTKIDKDFFDFYTSALVFNPNCERCMSENVKVFLDFLKYITSFKKVIDENMQKVLHFYKHIIFDVANFEGEGIIFPEKSLKKLMNHNNFNDFVMLTGEKDFKIIKLMREVLDFFEEKIFLTDSNNKNDHKEDDHKEDDYVVEYTPAEKDFLKKVNQKNFSDFFKKVDTSKLKHILSSLIKEGFSFYNLFTLKNMLNKLMGDMKKIESNDYADIEMENKNIFILNDFKMLKLILKDVLLKAIKELEKALSYISEREIASEKSIMAPFKFEGEQYLIIYFLEVLKRINSSAKTKIFLENIKNIEEQNFGNNEKSFVDTIKKECEDELDDFKAYKKSHRLFEKAENILEGIIKDLEQISKELNKLNGEDEKNIDKATNIIFYYYKEKEDILKKALKHVQLIYLEDIRIDLDDMLKLVVKYIFNSKFWLKYLYCEKGDYSYADFSNFVVRDIYDYLSKEEFEEDFILKISNILKELVGNIYYNAPKQLNTSFLDEWLGEFSCNEQYFKLKTQIKKDISHDYAEKNSFNKSVLDYVTESINFFKERKKSFYEKIVSFMEEIYILVEKFKLQAGEVKLEEYKKSFKYLYSYLMKQIIKFFKERKVLSIVFHYNSLTINKIKEMLENDNNSNPGFEDKENFLKLAENLKDEFNEFSKDSYDFCYGLLESVIWLNVEVKLYGKELLKNEKILKNKPLYDVNKLKTAVYFAKKETKKLLMFDILDNSYLELEKNTESIDNILNTKIYKAFNESAVIDKIIFLSPSDFLPALSYVKEIEIINEGIFDKDIFEFKIVDEICKEILKNKFYKNNLRKFAEFEIGKLENLKIDSTKEEEEKFSRYSLEVLSKEFNDICDNSSIEKEEIENLPQKFKMAFKHYFLTDIYTNENIAIKFYTLISSVIDILYKIFVKDELKKIFGVKNFNLFVEFLDMLICDFSFLNYANFSKMNKKYYDNYEKYKLFFYENDVFRFPIKFYLLCDKELKENKEYFCKIPDYSDEKSQDEQTKNFLKKFKVSYHGEYNKQSFNIKNNGELINDLINFLDNKLLLNLFKSYSVKEIINKLKLGLNAFLLEDCSEKQLVFKLNLLFEEALKELKEVVNLANVRYATKDNSEEFKNLLAIIFELNFRAMCFITRENVSNEIEKENYSNVLNKILSMFKDDINEHDKKALENLIASNNKDSKEDLREFCDKNIEDLIKKYESFSKAITEINKDKKYANIFCEQVSLKSFFKNAVDIFLDEKYESFYNYYFHAKLGILELIYNSFTILKDILVETKQEKILETFSDFISILFKFLLKLEIEENYNAAPKLKNKSLENFKLLQKSFRSVYSQKNFIFKLQQLFLESFGYKLIEDLNKAVEKSMLSLINQRYYSEKEIFNYDILKTKFSSLKDILRNKFKKIEFLFSNRNFKDNVYRLYTILDVVIYDSQENEDIKDDNDVVGYFKFLLGMLFEIFDILFSTTEYSSEIDVSLLKHLGVHIIKMLFSDCLSFYFNFNNLWLKADEVKTFRKNIVLCFIDQISTFVLNLKDAKIKDSKNKRTEVAKQIINNLKSFIENGCDIQKFKIVDEQQSIYNSMSQLLGSKFFLNLEKEYDKNWCDLLNILYNLLMYTLKNGLYFKELKNYFLKEDSFLLTDFNKNNLKLGYGVKRIVEENEQKEFVELNFKKLKEQLKQKNEKINTEEIDEILYEKSEKIYNESKRLKNKINRFLDDENIKFIKIIKEIDLADSWLEDFLKKELNNYLKIYKDDFLIKYYLTQKYKVGNEVPYKETYDEFYKLMTEEGYDENNVDLKKFVKVYYEIYAKNLDIDQNANGLLSLSLKRIIEELLLGTIKNFIINEHLEINPEEAHSIFNSMQTTNEVCKYLKNAIEEKKIKEILKNSGFKEEDQELFLKTLVDEKENNQENEKDKNIKKIIIDFLKNKIILKLIEYLKIKIFNIFKNFVEGYTYFEENQLKSSLLEKFKNFLHEINIKNFDVKQDDFLKEIINKLRKDLYESAKYDEILFDFEKDNWQIKETKINNKEIDKKIKEAKEKKLKEAEKKLKEENEKKKNENKESESNESNNENNENNENENKEYDDKESENNENENMENKNNENEEINKGTKIGNKNEFSSDDSYDNESYMGNNNENQEKKENEEKKENANKNMENKNNANENVIENNDKKGENKEPEKGIKEEKKESEENVNENEIKEEPEKETEKIKKEPESEIKEEKEKKLKEQKEKKKNEQKEKKLKEQNEKKKNEQKEKKLKEQNEKKKNEQNEKKTKEATATKKDEIIYTTYKNTLDFQKGVSYKSFKKEEKEKNNEQKGKEENEKKPAEGTKFKINEKSNVDFNSNKLNVTSTAKVSSFVGHAAKPAKTTGKVVTISKQKIRDRRKKFKLKKSKYKNRFKAKSKKNKAKKKSVKKKFRKNVRLKRRRKRNIKKITNRKIRKKLKRK